MARDVVRESLVGRGPQLDRFDEWVGALTGGTGRAVIIEGEAGIGKSSIVRSMTVTAAAAGAQVYWGAGEELSRAFPLLPILEALRANPATDERRTDIVETLRASDAVGVSIDRVTAAVEQLVSLFDDLCRTSPGVLVVDDLQWADDATVLTWGRLARSIARRPLLLVGMMRPVPRRDDLGALRRLLGDGDNGDDDGVLRLPGLTWAEGVELVEALVHGRAGPKLLQLAEGASGNPLYLTELVAALTRGHRLIREGGLVEATSGPTPSSLSAAIKDRLEFLSAPARVLVRSAALLGLDFALSELVVVTGQELVSLLPALDEASAAGVLRAEGTTLSFRHPLIRAALYDGMAAAIRAAWHREVGRLLAQHGASVEGVARQLLPALDGADPTPGAADHWIVTWLVDAGQQLVGQAPQAAIPLLRWAVAGTPVGTGHDVLACRLADVLYRVGDAAGAAAVATRALAQVADPDLLVDLHWTLTQCRVMQGLCDEALAELDRSLASPNLTRRHRARLLILDARVLRSIGRVDLAGEVAEKALADATAEDDRWAIGWALSVLTMVHGMRGDVDTALPLYDRALAVAEGEPALADLRLLLQINQANAYGLLDRYDEAIAAARVVRQLADRAGNVLRLSQAQSLLADLLFVVGAWDEALSEVDYIDQALSASKNPVVECYHHGTAAMVLMHRGEDGGRHLGAAEPFAAQIGKRVIYTLALARSLEREQADEPAHALAELREALAHSEEEPAETAALLADAVRLALRQGDLGSAEAAAARAQALTHGSDQEYRRATAAHCRGLIDRDPVPLIRAAEAYGTIGRPLPRAQALEAAAVAYAESGDTAPARTCYNDAFAGYQALGARWDLARIQATFRAYGIRRGPLVKHRRADHGWESLTPAERTVVALVAQGLSNPQIAAQLFLSRRTVQSHVSSILTKLKLHSRMDIAREAALRGRD